MKKINKDLIIEIKKTKTKFISILTIMFLGVFVFNGLFETPNTMNNTINTYLKKTNTYDIKITNKYLLNKEDEQKINKQENIKEQEYYYTAEAKEQNKNYEIKIESLPEKISTPILIKGKLPDKEDEIALTESLIKKYELGDTINFIQKTPKNTQETTKIKNTSYKIVGFVYGVDYPENTTNNAANTNYFAYITKENFINQKYSGVNITLKNINHDYTNKLYYEQVNQEKNKIIKNLKKQQEKNNKTFKETNLQKLNENNDKLKIAQQQILETKNKLDIQKQFLSNEIYLENIEKLEKNQKEIDTKIEQINISKEAIENTAYQQFLVENIKVNKHYKQFIDSAENFKSIAHIFSVFLFAVAILVSLTTLTRMIEENRTNIGTLKSLGYTNYQISKKYYLYGLFSTIIGSILGIIFSYIIIVPIIYNSYSRFLTLKEPLIKINIEIITLSLFTAISCITIAVYLSLRKILKEKSAYLLRPKAPKSGSRIFLEKIPFFWNKISFLQKITFRNIFRYKIRMMMTIFGIFGSLALMFVGFGIRFGVINISNEQFKIINNYDIIATHNPYLTKEEQKNLDDKIKTIKEITDYKKINIQKGTIEKNNEILDTLSVITLENTENYTKYFTLSNNKNNLTPNDDGVIISEKLAYLHDLKIGDYVNINIDEQEYKIKIANITKNYFGHIIYMTNGYYEKNINKKFKNNSYLIKANFEKERINKIILELENDENIFHIQNNINFQEVLDNFIQGIDIIVLVIVLCSITLSIVVLYNLININISERIRELSTIKVLGFYSKEVTNYIFREIFYLGIIGIIIGNYVGYKLYQKIILDLAGREMMFEKNSSIYVYIICSTITFVIILIVMLIMHIRLKKVDMVESLKGVE